MASRGTPEGPRLSVKHQTSDWKEKARACVQLLVTLLVFPPHTALKPCAFHQAKQQCLQQARSRRDAILERLRAGRKSGFDEAQLRVCITAPRSRRSALAASRNIVSSPVCSHVFVQDVIASEAREILREGTQNGGRPACRSPAFPPCQPPQLASPAAVFAAALCLARSVPQQGWSRLLPCFFAAGSVPAPSTPEDAGMRDAWVQPVRTTQ